MRSLLDLDEVDMSRIGKKIINVPAGVKVSIEKDRIIQYTTFGIHKDDLAMDLAGYSLKKSGSQGQQKTFLVALKLAEFEFIRKL